METAIMDLGRVREPSVHTIRAHLTREPPYARHLARDGGLTLRIVYARDR